MIITCPCKKKKFIIDGSLIPSKGRSLECGFCHHVWFYTRDEKIENTVSKRINLKILLKQKI